MKYFSKIVTKTKTGLKYLKKNGLSITGEKLLLKYYKNSQDFNKIDEYLIDKYREHDKYSLDIVIQEKKEIYTKSVLPSEPKEGITYIFNPSGYIIKNKDPNICVLPTPWRNLNNYTHWLFCEVPLIILALEGPSKDIYLPRKLINPESEYQKRWIEIILEHNEGKNIIPFDEYDPSIKGIIPINHDTSDNTKKIGKAMYKWYHHSRTTPYTIDIHEKYKSRFLKNFDNIKEKIYIGRKDRLLKNENEVREFVEKQGYSILYLENLSVDEQIFLFERAKSIIGFHEAGLANLLYSNTSQKVLEIVDSDCVYPSHKDGVLIPGKKATRTYFHLLSVMKNIEYTAIETSNYHLDLKELEKYINSINI